MLFRSARSTTTGSLWYADISDEYAHEFYSQGSAGASFFMSAGARDSMDACGATCWADATANYAAFASASGYGGYCFNTELIIGTTATSDLAAVSAPSKEEKASATAKPHIVMVTMDDMGWNDVGYQSIDLGEATPFLNKLAAKSVKLTKYYTQPSCTPSRVTMMTGKWAYKNGFQNYELEPSAQAGVPLSNELMPAYLRSLGYKTVGFGKWNIGHCSEDYMPHSRGFEHFLGYFCPGHGYTDYNCGSNSELKDMYEGYNSYAAGSSSRSWATGAGYVGTYDTAVYQAAADKAVAAHGEAFGNGTPLFLWMAHHGMHGESDSDPEPPASLLTADNQEYLKTLKKREALAAGDDKKFFKKRFVTASVLMSLDNALESLVSALNAAGMMANTVLVVNSDNGEIGRASCRERV